MGSAQVSFSTRCHNRGRSEHFTFPLPLTNNAHTSFYVCISPAYPCLAMQVLTLPPSVLLLVPLSFICFASAHSATFGGFSRVFFAAGPLPPYHMPQQGIKCNTLGSISPGAQPSLTAVFECIILLMLVTVYIFVHVLLLCRSQKRGGELLSHSSGRFLCFRPVPW
jgi:hypothetical protein